MRFTSEDPRHRGFSLLELLVSIGIIALLLAIVLPILARSRGMARQAECLARMRGLMQGFLVVAGDQQSRWPNAWHGTEQEPYQAYHPGDTTVFGLAYFDQTRYWTPLLIDAVWQQGDTGDVFACPAAIDEWPVGGEGAVPNYGARSYMYSAALLSSPNLWASTPEGAKARANSPERHKSWVLTSNVAFPANKVALAEVADHHGRGDQLDSGTIDAVNAGFADGHVRRVRPSEASPALGLTITPPAHWRPEGPVPFSAAADGYLGRDF